MERYERFYRRTLRDVLVGHGLISPEQADELAESAYEANESFGYAVVDAGLLTAWDLAKTIATHYQMPVLPLRGFEYDSAITEGMSAATLYQYQILPVGRFGDTWSFAVAEPPSRDCLNALREAFGGALFFFVAEADHVKQMITDHLKVVDAEADRKWQSIFDSADELIRAEMDVTGNGSDEEIDLEIE